MSSMCRWKQLSDLSTAVLQDKATKFQGRIEYAHRNSHRVGNPVRFVHRHLGLRRITLLKASKLEFPSLQDLRTPTRHSKPSPPHMYNKRRRNSTLGLYSALRACSAIVFNSSLQSIFTVDTIFLSRTHKSRLQQPNNIQEIPKPSRQLPTTSTCACGQNQGGMQHPSMARTWIQHVNIQFRVPSRAHNPRPLPQNQTLSYETPSFTTEAQSIIHMMT